MAEDICERTGLRDRATKGVVGVGGDDVARRVGVAEDVAVGVGVGNVDHAVALDIEESAHAARALQGAGEVASPIEVELFCCSVRVVHTLVDEVPVVIEERVHGVGRDLLHAATAAVILVRDKKNAVRRHGDEL